MKILYFGNRSGQRGNYPTVQDELTPLFQKEFTVISVSDKQGNFRKALDMFFTFWKHISSADLILIDTFSTKNFYFALSLAIFSKISNKPYVNYLHGGDLPKRLKNNPILSTLAFKGAYRLIAPSNFMKVSFEKYGYKTTLIPNMLRIENYVFKQRCYANARLFWLRSFRKHYNPMLAVKVLAELRATGIDANLVMVGPDGGDGSLAEVKVFIDRNNLHNYVSITGFMSKNEWIGISADRNILINTTNIDNTPISVIECMGLGMAVVSTAVGGIPYLLDNETDSLLVPADNVGSMKDAITRILLNPDYALKLTLNARKKVESFDWKVVKKLWNNVFTNFG